MGNKWLSFSSSGRSSETMSRSHLTRPPSKLTFSTAPPKDSIFCPKKIWKSQRTRKRSIFFLGTLPRRVPSTWSLQLRRHLMKHNFEQTYRQTRCIIFCGCKDFPPFEFSYVKTVRKRQEITHMELLVVHTYHHSSLLPLKLPSEKLKRKVKIGRNWAELTVNPIGRFNYSSSGLILHEIPRCFQNGAFLTFM